MNGIMRRPGLLWLLLGPGCCGCLQSDAEPALLPMPDPMFTLVDDLPDFDQTATPAEHGEILPLIQAAPVPESGDTRSTMKPVNKPATETQPQQPVQPPEQPRSGFTGAIVFVKGDCPPCINLVTDLQYLAQHHGWSLADKELTTIRPKDEIDWLISHGEGAPAYPIIEFYREGELIGESRGYSQASQFADRREPLLNLIRSHPRYTAAHR